MFQQNDQESNQQQQNDSQQQQQQQQSQNQNIQTNQQQKYFWRNVPYSEQQISLRNQVEKIKNEIEGLPTDRAIHRQYLEKTCNKFKSNFLSPYDDVGDFEQLHKIIDEQYKISIQTSESNVSQIPNLCYWNDKIKISELYYIMKIIKSPNRSLYLRKDITQEVYFDEIKENLNPEELEYLNNLNDQYENLKGQGIFENFKVQPTEVLKKQLNLIKQQEFQNEDHYMCFEIYKILVFPHLYFNQYFYKYDVEKQSVYFKLPKNIVVEVKSNEIEQNPLLNQNSIIKLIPTSLLQNNILSFLGFIDIFKLRIVCRYFKTIVEKYWYIPHHKENIEYNLAKDIACTIEYFKYLQIAAEKIKQKLRDSVDMIMNIINWENLHQQIEQNQIEIDVYRPLIMMLRLFNKQQKICYTYEIDGQFDITQLAKDIKQQINDYLNLEFIPLSFKQMREIQSQALSAPEFHIVGAIDPELNLSQLLIFLLQGLYFYGWMHQIVAIQNEILKKRRKELQNFDQKQNYNQQFLTKQSYKYIYKMNEFQPSQDTEEQTEIMKKLGQIFSDCLKDLNFQPDANPSTKLFGVVYQKKDVINIHLDVYFQIEILSYVCNRNKYYFEDQYVNNSKLEKNFNQFKNSQQINEEDEKSKQQSENIDPQSDLNNQQNEPN